MKSLNLPLHAILLHNGTSCNIMHYGHAANVFTLQFNPHVVNFAMANAKKIDYTYEESEKKLGELHKLQNSAGSGWLPAIKEIV